jgi:hypothetical protein
MTAAAIAHTPSATIVVSTTAAGGVGGGPDMGGR